MSEEEESEEDEAHLEVIVEEVTDDFLNSTKDVLEDWTVRSFAALDNNPVQTLQIGVECIAALFIKLCIGCAPNLRSGLIASKVLSEKLIVSINEYASNALEELPDDFDHEEMERLIRAEDWEGLVVLLRKKKERH